MQEGLYTRAGIYWARFKVRGIEYRKSLRTRSETIAKRRLKQVKQSVEDQIYYGAADPKSWPEAVISWTSAQRSLGLKGKTADRYKTSLRQMRPWLDDIEVQKIDAALLKAIVRDRQKQGVTNATIRRDMTAVSSVLGHCVDEDWIEDNPARMMDRSRFKEKRVPIKQPHQDDIDRLFALGSRFIGMAELSLETGMREEEIASLGHRQIDRVRKMAEIEEAKWDQTRQVPLSEKAIAIIDRQPRYLNSDYVFWLKEGQRFQNVGAQFYSTVKRVAQRAAQQGIVFRRFRFHDLRHLFAIRYLRERRGSLYDLQLILGHESIKTTEEYLQYLAPDERRAAIQGVAQNEAQDQRSEAGEIG